MCLGWECVRASVRRLWVCAARAPIPVLNVYTGQRLSRPRHKLDAHTLRPQRILRHMIHVLLEQLVIVLVVDGSTYVRQDLVWRQLAVCNVRIDGIVQEHLKVDGWLGREPLSHRT